jgi:hypothetical protein
VVNVSAPLVGLRIAVACGCGEPTGNEMAAAYSVVLHIWSNACVCVQLILSAGRRRSRLTDGKLDGEICK